MLFKHGFDFLGIYLESIRGYDKSEVLGLCRLEFTLIDVNLELYVP